MSEPNEIQARPCTLIRRLAAMLYDGVVVIALLILATMLAMLLGLGHRTAMKDPGYTLYLFCVWFLYLGWFWRRGGMTVGMRAWRIRIEDESGERPSWGKLALRFIFSFVSAAAAGLGFLWSLFDPRKRTWHDMLSKTRLVRS